MPTHIWSPLLAGGRQQTAGHLATGALVLPAVTATGTATQGFFATGALVLPALTVAGLTAIPLWMLRVPTQPTAVWDDRPAADPAATWTQRYIP